MITVVSGLPRSGTSLMMQILRKAGIENHTDSLRKADESNPNGYAEFEPVKSLMKDNSFLREIDNKSIKIVSPLLPFADSSLQYRVIFMYRDIDEILDSQQVMLGKEKGAAPAAMRTVFENHYNKSVQFAANNGYDHIEINHRDLLNLDVDAFQKIKDFLNTHISVEELMSCVDQKLHRQKK